MLLDLASQNPDSSQSTDVLIIGGGIAGLLLAVKLRDRKLRVVVLESGGREQKDDLHPLNRVVLLGDNYRGASHGRFRCLGGTSTRWGGALIPFLEEDMQARPHLGLPAWPIGMEAVTPYMPEIEALFGLDAATDDDVPNIGTGFPIGDRDFVARLAKWPSFKNRNVGTLFKSRIEGDPNLTVWINATAARFELDEAANQLRSVTARHQNGNSVKIAAKHNVVCAGAIESTRILLLLNHQYGDRVFGQSNALGRFFHDHISAPLATIKAKDVGALNRMAGFRFVGKTMRSLRFELSPSTQTREGVASAFGHISFQSEKPTGFDALRDFLRGTQHQGRIRPALALRILRDIPYLVKAGYWRYAHQQLYWPTPAKYELHIAAEQLPRSSNQITLSQEKDIFGLPLAAIRWKIESSDCTVFSTYLRLFEKYWKRTGLEKIGGLEMLVPRDTLSAADISHGGSIYHPGGSTRMGSDGESAIVDNNLRTFAVSNLSVASTSVFPSGASANPTLMLMLFTMRLADHLAEQFSGRANWGSVTKTRSLGLRGIF